MDEKIKENYIKKILQLTRTIFLINAKNEDNKSTIDLITESYDKEQFNSIENFVKEINNLKEKIKKLNINYEEKYKKFISEIKKNYEIKINEIQKKLNILNNKKKNINDEIKYDIKIKNKSK